MALNLSRRLVPALVMRGLESTTGTRYSLLNSLPQTTAQSNGSAVLQTVQTASEIDAVTPFLFQSFTLVSPTSAVINYLCVKRKPILNTPRTFLKKRVVVILTSILF